MSASDGKDEFNLYVLPEKPISPAASQVTQLTINKSKMYHKGKPVKAERGKEALQKFIVWLKGKKQKALLFGHNAKAFDCKRIVYSLIKYDLLSSFEECVAGFVDTLILFKKVLPSRKSYSQENLVNEILGESYMAHDSLEDVRALEKLVSQTKAHVNAQQMAESSITLGCAVNTTEHCLRKAVNVKTLQPLIMTNVVSKGMAEKIAGANL